MDFVGRLPFSCARDFCDAWRNSTALPWWEAYQILLLFQFCFTTVNRLDNRMTTVSTTQIHKWRERLWWSFADKPIVPTWLVHLFEQNLTDSQRKIMGEGQGLEITYCWVILKGNLFKRRCDAWPSSAFCWCLKKCLDILKLTLETSVLSP